MFSGGHASVVERLLKLSKRTIDLDGKWLDKTGYEWAKEEGHTAVVELLEKAGHTS